MTTAHSVLRSVPVLCGGPARHLETGIPDTFHVVVSVIARRVRTEIHTVTRGRCHLVMSDG